MRAVAGMGHCQKLLCASIEDLFSLLTDSQLMVSTTIQRTRQVSPRNDIPIALDSSLVCLFVAPCFPLSPPPRVLLSLALWPPPPPFPFPGASGASGPRLSLSFRFKSPPPPSFSFKLLLKN